MTIDQIDNVLKSKDLDFLTRCARDYLLDRRELDAMRRIYAPLKDRTFFYLYASDTSRTETQLETGIVENPRERVRTGNETIQIGKRIDEALKRNLHTRNYETADGVKHDGCATLEARCLELYRTLKALKPLLEAEATENPRRKFTRQAVKPALTIIDQGEKAEKEGK